MQVPSFLARQFYVAKSLRNTPTGFQLQARNPLGGGTLVGVLRLAVDGRPIAVEAVSARREGEETAMHAADVSRLRPIKVAIGDVITLHVEGEQLAPGAHRLEVELLELNLGALRLSISDELAGGRVDG